jgi:hypothetical protein
MRFEEAILVVWGLCADGQTNAEGRPSPLFGALLATRFAGRAAFGGRPMRFKGSCSRHSPRSRGYGAWSARSIATSLSRRTPPPKRGSVASRNR